MDRTWNLQFLGSAKFIRREGEIEVGFLGKSPQNERENSSKDANFDHS